MIETTIGSVDAHRIAAPATDAATPGLPPAMWERISQKVLEHGTSTPPMGVSLEIIKGDPRGTHSAEYVTVGGGGTMVSEHWRLANDGNFHITQWIHWIGSEGDHLSALHGNLVLSPSNIVLSSKSESVPVGDPRAAFDLQRLGAMWDAFDPTARSQNLGRDRFSPARAKPYTRVAPRSALVLQPPRV